jgi:hypothetical protein
MAFIVSRPDDGAESFLCWWDETRSAWGPDRAKAHRFPDSGAAMDAAMVFDRKDLPQLGRISIIETD